MPQTIVTEDCGCDTPNLMDPKSHDPSCPVVKHFKQDGQLKKDVVLTINQRAATS